MSATTIRVAAYFLREARLLRGDFKARPREIELGRAANAFERLAAHVMSLPADDECCRELMACSLSVEQFTPTPDGWISRVVRDYGLGGAVGDRQTFLRSLPKLAARDMVEFAMDLGVLDG